MLDERALRIGAELERKSNGRRYVVEVIDGWGVTLRAVGGDGKRRSVTTLMHGNVAKKFRTVPSSKTGEGELDDRSPSSQQDGGE